MIPVDENNKMRVWMQSLAPLVLVTVACCRCSSPAPPQEEPIREQQEAVEDVPAVEPEEEEEEEEPAEEFEVSEEVYTKTFDEIEEFICNLNDIIRGQDYDTWLTYLSDEYIERTNDPAYLREQSEQPLLKKSNISLTSLRDYFDYVVVPSRVQAQLDEIEFIGENQVKAYAMIRNTKALLYLLVRENDKWKIGVW
jgi:hypothetical protein